jgi:hypothetical protein
MELNKQVLLFGSNQYCLDIEKKLRLEFDKETSKDKL